MTALKLAALLLIATPLTSCVSAVIALSGKKEITYPRNRQELVSAYGEPVLSGKAIPGLSTQGTVRWEIYEYRGLMRDEGFANAAATAGGCTLGGSEVISLPSVALNRAASAASRHLFLAEYRRDGEIHPFRRISSKELAEYRLRTGG